MSRDVRPHLTYYARDDKEGMSVAEVQLALASAIGVKQARTNLRGKITQITVYVQDGQAA